MPGRVKRSERSLGDLDDLVESGGINDGDVGEHLTVENDVRLLETVDELAITKSAHTNSGVDADDPEATEISFPRATVARRVNVGAKHGLLDCSQELATTAAETLGALEETILGATTRGTFGNSHSYYPLCYCVFIGSVVSVRIPLPGTFASDCDNSTKTRSRVQTLDSAAFTTRFQKPNDCSCAK